MSVTNQISQFLSPSRVGRRAAALLLAVGVVLAGLLGVGTRVALAETTTLTYRIGVDESKYKDIYIQPDAEVGAAPFLPLTYQGKFPEKWYDEDGNEVTVITRSTGVIYASWGDDEEYLDGGPTDDPDSWRRFSFIVNSTDVYEGDPTGTTANVGAQMPFEIRLVKKYSFTNGISEWNDSVARTMPALLGIADPRTMLWDFAFSYWSAWTPGSTGTIAVFHFNDGGSDDAHNTYDYPSYEDRTLVACATTNADTDVFYPVRFVSGRQLIGLEWIASGYFTDDDGVTSHIYTPNATELTDSDIPAEYKKANMVLSGWRELGKSTNYDFTTEVTGGLTLVAQYTDDPDSTRTVTFYRNDGSQGSAAVFHTAEVTFNTAASQPSPDPVRQNYEFMYWETASGAEWDFSTPVTQDLELYAHWNPRIVLTVDNANPYVVKASEVGGQLGTPDQLIIRRGIGIYADSVNPLHQIASVVGDTPTALQSIGVPSRSHKLTIVVPEKEGCYEGRTIEERTVAFDFDGYWTTGEGEDGTQLISSNGEVLDALLEYIAADNVNVTKIVARWTPKNNALPTIADMPGYEQTGWRVQNSDETFQASSYTPQTDTTLEVVLTPIRYDITYAGTVDGEPVSLPKGGFTIEDEVALAAGPSRDGYTFAGWKLGRESTYAGVVHIEGYDDGDLATAIHKGSYGNIRATVDDSSYVAKICHVTLDSGDPSDGATKSVYVRYGDHRLYSDPEGTTELALGDLKLPARTYTVSFDARGGTPDPDPVEKEVFNGYLAGGSKIIEKGASSVTVNWGAVDALVAATTSGEATATASYDASIALPVVERVNYTYRGWATDPNAQEGMTDANGDLATTYVPTADIMLYAVWTQGAREIVYDLGEGGYWPSGNPYTRYFDTDNFTQFTMSLSDAGAPKRDGFTLAGWYQQGTADVKLSGDEENGYVVSKDDEGDQADVITLVADWDPSYYTMRLVLDNTVEGASTVPAALASPWRADSRTPERDYTRTYNRYYYVEESDSGVITLPTPTCYGYAFTGWKVSNATPGAESDGVLYVTANVDAANASDGASVVYRVARNGVTGALYTISAGNTVTIAPGTVVTLHRTSWGNGRAEATWEARSYDVTLKANGATKRGETSATTSDPDELDVTPSVMPALAGRATFDSTFSVPSLRGITSSSDLTLSRSTTVTFYGDLATPRVASYDHTMDGWATSAGGDKAYDVTAAAVPTASVLANDGVSLYAHWLLTQVGSAKTNDGAATDVLYTPTARANQQFVGWVWSDASTDTDQSVVAGYAAEASNIYKQALLDGNPNPASAAGFDAHLVTSEEDFGGIRNVNLHAVWVPGVCDILYYDSETSQDLTLLSDVTWLPRGSDSIAPGTTVTPITKFAIGEIDAGGLVLRKPERAGYTFAGWSLERDGNPDPSMTIAANTTNDVIVYAHFEEKTGLLQIDPLPKEGVVTLRISGKATPGKYGTNEVNYEYFQTVSNDGNDTNATFVRLPEGTYGVEVVSGGSAPWLSVSNDNLAFTGDTNGKFVIVSDQGTVPIVRVTTMTDTAASNGRRRGAWVVNGIQQAE